MGGGGGIESIPPLGGKVGGTGKSEVDEKPGGAGKSEGDGKPGGAGKSELDEKPGGGGKFWLSSVVKACSACWEEPSRWVVMYSPCLMAFSRCLSRVFCGWRNLFCLCLPPPSAFLPPGFLAFSCLSCSVSLSWVSRHLSKYWPGLVYNFNPSLPSSL